jgi:uncharacterized protein (TIGR03086 family)
MPIEKSVFVPLDADETFALITRPDRLRRWQAITARVDLRAGGEYRWTIVPGHVARGTITELEPGKRVVLTWGWEGDTDLPPGASTVTITLEPAPGGTTVRLVHDGLSEEQAANHAMGWEHYFGRLARAVTDGDGGLDEWAAASGDPITSAALTLAACQRVLLRIGEADHGKTTVCGEFTVAGLADHLIKVTTGWGGAAGASFPAAAAGTLESAATGTLESKVADAAQIALEAWDSRGLDGTVTIATGETMPADMAAGMLSIEFLVHASDFAGATGQQVTVPEEAAAYVLDLACKIITPGIRAGRFGDERPAGTGAGALGRLIAFTGRPVLATDPA